jgi:hypothetical protein
VTILALDLSKRSTGWACWMEGDENPHYGTWVLGSEFTSDGQTYAKLHACLLDLRALSRFEHIYYEEPLRPETLQGHTNIDTLRVLAGLAAHAESFGYAVGCRSVSAVHMASWRRHFIGSMPRGTKTKLLKEYARERCRTYGWSTANDDEADALGLLDYGCELKGIRPPWRADEVLRPVIGQAR